MTIDDIKKYVNERLEELRTVDKSCFNDGQLFELVLLQAELDGVKSIPTNE